MAWTYVEVIKSRASSLSADGLQCTRIFQVSDASPNVMLDAEIVLQQFVEPTLGLFLRYGMPHPTIPSLYLKSAKAEASETIVEVTLEYAPVEADAREDDNREIWEWTWAAKEEHITSVHDVALTPYPPDPSAGVSDAFKQWNFPVNADVGTAIGSTGEDVKGVDVYRPTIAIRVTKRYTGTVSAAFRRILVDMEGKVNVDSFGEFKPYEVLFTGAEIEPIRGSRNAPYYQQGEYRIKFNFLAARQAAPLTVKLVDETTVGPLLIRPWDYIWYRHRGKLKAKEHLEGLPTDPNDYNDQKGVESVHVAQVYAADYFNLFALQGPSY